MSSGERLGIPRAPEKATLKHRTQRLLEQELEKLKKTAGLGYELSMKWAPDPRTNLSGEVKRGVIYVYESEAKALETLRHEFMEYLISQPMEPYKEMTNSLIKMVNEEAYRRKERVVDALMRLIGESPSEQGLAEK